MKRDQGESIGAESGGVLKAEVEIQLCFFPVTIVPLLASNLTRATANTLGYINQVVLMGVSAASCVMIFFLSSWTLLRKRSAS